MATGDDAAVGGNRAGLQVGGETTTGGLTKWDLTFSESKKIDLYWLSQNSNAIELLRELPFNINWFYLFKNPNIFTYDYDKMRENMLLFKEDLMKERFHPRNLRKFSSWGHSGGIDDEDDE